MKILGGLVLSAALLVSSASAATFVQNLTWPNAATDVTATSQNFLLFGSIGAPAGSVLTSVTLSITITESVNTIILTNTSSVTQTFRYFTQANYDAADTAGGGVDTGALDGGLSNHGGNPSIPVYSSGLQTLAAGGVFTASGLPQTLSATSSITGTTAAYAGAGTAALTYSTLTSDVLAGGGGNINASRNTTTSAVATITYNYTIPAVPPTITKAFSPSTVAPGGTSTLSFTITNPSATTALTAIGFTDTPPGVSVTPIAGTPACNGGTLSATSTTITLTGGTLSPSASCTFSVLVTAGATPGAFINTTSVVTSSGGNGQPATATLTVTQPGVPPTITKAFGALALPFNAKTTVTFVITNPNTNPPTNPPLTLTGIAFTDTLPTGLFTADSLTGNCGGTVSVTPTTIALTGGTLAPGASCTITLNVFADGQATGTVINTTGLVTTNQTPPGGPATATIFLGDPYEVSYAVHLNKGDSIVNITNTGAAGASNQSGTSAAIPGSICVNVYVFDPTEETVSCCSCPVTPNGLVSLSVRSDLISNPLFPATPTSVVIKLLATTPVAGSCQNSALLANAQLSQGLAAWDATLHTVFNGVDSSPLAVTEKPFTGAILSPGEFARLGYSCGVAVGQGSGGGICNSCRIGGLGGTRR